MYYINQLPANKLTPGNKLKTNKDHIVTKPNGNDALSDIHRPNELFILLKLKHS